MKFLNFNKYFLLIGLLISFNALQASAGGDEAAIAAARAAEEAVAKEAEAKAEQDKAKKDLADKQAEKDRLQQDEDDQRRRIQDDEDQKEQEILDKVTSDEIDKSIADSQINALKKAQQDAISKLADNFLRRQNSLDLQIKDLTKKIADQKQIDQDLAKHAEALQLQVQKTAKTALDRIQTSVDSFVPQFVAGKDPFTEANWASSSQKKLSIYDGAETVLTSEQQQQKNDLQIQAKALLVDAHAAILHHINDEVNKVVSSEGLSLDAQVGSIKNAIESGYGSDASSPFNQESQDFLQVVRRAESATSESEKQDEVYGVQDELQKVTDKVLQESNDSKETIDNSSNGNNKDLLSEKLEKNKNILKNDSDQLAVNSGKLIQGQEKITVTNLLNRIDKKLIDGDYDIKPGKSAEDLIITLDDALNSLGKANEFLISEIKNLQYGIDYVDDLLDQKKIDTALGKIKDYTDKQEKIKLKFNELVEKRLDLDFGIEYANNQLQKSLDEANSSVEKADGIIKSTISRMGSAVIDVFSTLFSKFKNVIFNKSVTEFKDQAIEIKKGVEVMKQDCDAYKKQVDPLTNSVSKYDLNSIKDAKKVNAQYSDALSLLSKLERAQVQVEIRNNGLNRVLTDATAVDVFSNINKELNSIEFFKKDNNFDAQKMKDYFISLSSLSDDNLISLGKNYYTVSGLEIDENDPSQHEKFKSFGQKIFENIKNKEFLSMNYNQVLILARCYELKDNNGGGQDFQFLLKRGGEFAWQQVKTVLAGEKSYQEKINSSNDDFVKSVINPLKEINKIILSLKNGINSAINQLKLWIDSVDSVLGKQPSSWENQQIAIDKYISQKTIENRGGNRIIGSNLIMSLPEPT